MNIVGMLLVDNDVLKAIRCDSNQDEFIEGTEYPVVFQALSGKNSLFFWIQSDKLHPMGGYRQSYTMDILSNYNIFQKIKLNSLGMGYEPL